MIQLSIIVLCYRGDRWIGPCVDSLEKQTLERSRYEIVLADNGGFTPSLQRYGQAFQTKVVRFDANYGFTGGNNRALGYARGGIVLLLNQDVVVHRECLEKILEAFSRIPDAGAIAANMFFIHRQKEADMLGTVPQAAGLYHVGKFGFAQYQRVKTAKSMIPQSFLSGNGLAFRKGILENAGGFLFDEQLGSYAEDLDFSLRLAKAGKTMFVARQAVLYHFRDTGFPGSLREQVAKFVHISSNRLVVYWKNDGRKRFFTRLPLLLIGVGLKMGRMDGARRFDWGGFIAGMALIPMVILRFWIKSARVGRSLPHSIEEGGWPTDENQ